MIKIGDTIKMSGYDAEQMQYGKREYVVVEIHRYFVRTKHKKAGYRECFTIWDLVQNGYVPNFENAIETGRPTSHTSQYGTTNKLLLGYLYD